LKIKYVPTVHVVVSNTNMVRVSVEEMSHYPLFIEYYATFIHLEFLSRFLVN
jgi:hypothetical protein